MADRDSTIPIKSLLERRSYEFDAKKNSFYVSATGSPTRKQHFANGKAHLHIKRGR